MSSRLNSRSGRGRGTGLQWSEQQLAAYRERRTGASATTLPHPLALDPMAAVDPQRALQALATRNAGPLGGRLQRAVASIKNARIKGEYVVGQRLRLEFEGAMTLSPNELYKLTHYRRIPYRHAWHEAVYWAVLQVTGKNRRPAAFEQFSLTGQRCSTQLCDPDALNGYFKYVIDGLRYAGIIVDDKPKNLLDLRTTQIQGEPALTVEVIRMTAAPLPGNELSSDRARSRRR